MIRAMVRTKQQLAHRRYAVLAGLIGGVLLFGIIRPMSAYLPRYPEQTPKGTYALFFGNIADWPGFVQNFWPLDLIMTCVFMTLVMYCMPGGRSSNDTPVGLKDWAKTGLGVFIGTGSLGGVMASACFGWFIGLEIFFLFGAVCMVFVGVMMTIAVGGSWLVMAVASKVSELWTGSRLQQKAQPITRPVARFGTYLDGGDAPADSTEPPQSQNHPSQPQS